MTVGEGGVDAAPKLSEEELSWLGALADGGTVTEVAAATGRSERDMYVRLNDIYVRLGVRSRSRALAEAARRGWITSKNGSESREGGPNERV